MQRTLTTLAILTTLTALGCSDNSSQENEPNASREPGAYFDECVQGCLADRGLSEDECALACEDHAGGDCATEADDAYAECLEEGGSEEECRRRAEESYDACAGDRTETGTDPCAAVSDQAWQDCIDAGGTDEDCREEAAAAYDECANGTSTTR